MTNNRNESYFVVGRKEDGSTVYYTGRAGQGFINDAFSQAFAYNSLNVARNRATNLNQMTAIHGVRFFVPVQEESWRRLGQSPKPEHYALVLP